ncbi:hypothetical protein KOAAANKH_01136 [Brevundimonas sp. NIBR10]|uniref:hypothetical protein n=1 Tax=Brevundimonas sp. NIBR10 TaxID=3015997 RepID=UPI0022F1CDAC|nr:hypothetical protein [Brevundimonas sp. NIBR10]WGM46268.1 hypothetical protein KOAAANKH_01136 [Brevundimonas sp. NIBR10]
MSNARAIQAIALVLVAGGALAVRLLQERKPEPAPDDETARLTPEIRTRLTALRAEARDWTLGPDAASPKVVRRVETALNTLIDDILSEPDGPLEAADVAGRLGLGLAALKTAPAPMTALAWGRMIEVWYVLGFRSPTGYFNHDPADLPEGWGEPLPPGWTAPDRPRPVATGTDR